jgi:hypothetical protein
MEKKKNIMALEKALISIYGMAIYGKYHHYFGTLMVAAGSLFRSIFGRYKFISALPIPEFKSIDELIHQGKIKPLPVSKFD